MNECCIGNSKRSLPVDSDFWSQQFVKKEHVRSKVRFEDLHGGWSLRLAVVPYEISQQTAYCPER